MNSSKIECPNCSHTFSVEDSIAKNIEEKYQKEFQQKQLKFREEKELNDKAQALKELKEEKEAFDLKIQKEKLEAERLVEEKV